MDYNPYSVRQQLEARSQRPQIVSLDTLPAEMRAQAVHALSNLMGNDASSPGSRARWGALRQALLEEHGLLSLRGGIFARDQVIDYFVKLSSVDKALDVIELAIRQAQLTSGTMPGSPDKRREEELIDITIKTLNRRFDLHELGFRIVGRPCQIVRADSQYAYSEMLVPAVRLLHDSEFDGALSEFMSANAAFRRGENKVAINVAFKSFESTLKTVCDRMGWTRETHWTASRLISTVIDRGLLPINLQSQIGSFRSIMESGVPAIRNSTSGHGQGEEVTEVADALASYALHLTAANIIFVVSRYHEAREASDPS